MKVGEIVKFLNQFPEEWAVEDMVLPTHRNTDRFVTEKGKLEEHYKIKITFSHTSRITET